MDRLVRNGTHFTNVFNMGGWNGAVCVASRSMIITGKTIWDAKSISDQWSKENLEAAQQNWGKLWNKRAIIPI